jgi:hypothetical protein
MPDEKLAASVNWDGASKISGFHFEFDDGKVMAHSVV